MRKPKKITVTCLGRSQECFSKLKNPEKCAYEIVRRGPIESDWVVYEFSSREDLKEMLIKHDSETGICGLAGMKHWFAVQKFGEPWNF